MNKSESKYFNTALLMNQAFLEILEKKDFEYISVKEICEKAGVNRSTFYLHYETMADLLNECLEQANRNFNQSFKIKEEEYVAQIYHLSNHYELLTVSQRKKELRFAG